MSVLLYIVGALAFIAGAITLAFGFSIELSFGNSLIVAGTAAAVGGLIVIGLAAVVSQLQRVAEALLSVRAPVRPSSMPEMFEAGGPRAAAGEVPFPPRPRPRTAPPVEPPAAPPPAAPPEVAEAPAEDRFAAPPVLPNPDEPPVEVHEDVSLSPPPPLPEAAEPAKSTSFGFGRSSLSERENEEEERKTGWRFPPLRSRTRPEPPPPLPEESPPSPQSHFDAMWPAEDRTDGSAEFDKPERPKAAEPLPTELPPEAAPEPEAEPALAAPSAPTQPAAPAAPHEEADQPRKAAILKSGVVDGMGYTLYVDGSIDAELPQGTLHFNSINDLREYLEKNSQA